MTWYTRCWQHMSEVHQQAKADGKDPAGIAKAIDESYPYRSKRSGYAYKAWLAARRDFFSKHQLPLRRARQKTGGLFG
ncbi:hypothetical protein N5J43_08190 [Pseudomonas nicosulfuronedens]|uniref:hypothetical protein n=1 Tax=Pseudomonas nicosulfuronedens TaxID=2571105 RepID=UPI0024474C3E|nr:hypothetical protein [Pseudomonas nicosulfuronedens]MDH1009952.1 hypothetical protein [Pseudomonas nicosulfuronedens]MDH1978928.1 hypothetical protein [Pseudomonas nicosulfuronedens]MDH2028393.1 hypothetical protein [Pseudomonas nicosulfuronedens]